MLHQQAQNAAEAKIGGLTVGRERRCPRGLARANCASLCDAEIMRESSANNKHRDARAVVRFGV
jgi:hypothetical protein